MELILWRHAEAEDGLPDSARRLTEKGLKQAQSMAEWLKPRLPKNTRIIASPTMRTRQTAEALDDDFETVKEIGPAVSAKAILSAADWPNAKGAVVVVGHQPTLGEVAARLMSCDPMEWNIRKGAVWWFSYKKKEGIAETVLRTSISPDML
ncbi:MULTISPECIES: phosphohistidine phosphatase SixA [unclassified Nitrosovibrio]|uniref:phosphohistidine phosphatase SixA n=1 Tax=unclassified Nitrosovibrio TaxID=2624428 RepID=UPI0008D66214|nr:MULTISPECIES: phosphohistidine phosphatase SixA [unclassified Nitrosovibrio]SEP34712.1 phosphohistidine phosphatase [Nitrosovibrio sp. Nv6]SOD40151.1 phosphohistidine phosphatase, SixA [Nitrosovibrio sp. Nv4]